MGKHSIIGLSLWLAVGGCALVGFDEVEPALEVDPKNGNDKDEPDRRRDADVGEPTGRRDGGAMDAAAPEERRDAGDAATSDGSDGEDGAIDDDAGDDACDIDPWCDGTQYVYCDTDGTLTRTECYTGDSCRPGVCDANKGCLVQDAPDDTPCNDFLFCTTGDRCVAGRCEGGDPVDCSDFDGPCRGGVCDESKQACTFEARNQDASCGSELVCRDGWCSTGDLCAGDGCTAGCTDETGPCHLSCLNSVACNFSCATGADCEFDCEDSAGACNVDCASGASCVVNCADPADCANVVCALDASCTLLCAAGDCPEPMPPTL